MALLHPESEMSTPKGADLKEVIAQGTSSGSRQGGQVGRMCCYGNSYIRGIEW